MDLNNKLTHKSQEALVTAQQLAAAHDHQLVEPAHILYALLSDAEGFIYPVLHRLEQSPRALRDRVEEAIARIPRVYGFQQDVRLSQAASQVLEQAAAEMSAMGDLYVSTEHILLALLKDGGDVATLLASVGVTREAVVQALAEVRGRRQIVDQDPEEKFQVLERYGRDLTEAARQDNLDPVIGRDNEIRRVIQVLSRRTKNNPVLIGEPGVGKTAIVEGLAQRIVAGD